jgi:uncharacterized coiled-coil protein SlyX
MDTEDVHERMMDLEVRLAFQDQLLQQLDDVLRTLVSRLDVAEQTIRQLQNAEKSPALPVGVQADKPPHY